MNSIDVRTNFTSPHLTSTDCVTQRPLSTQISICGSSSLGGYGSVGKDPFFSGSEAKRKKFTNTTYGKSNSCKSSSSKLDSLVNAVSGLITILVGFFLLFFFVFLFIALFIQIMDSIARLAGSCGMSAPCRNQKAF